MINCYIRASECFEQLTLCINRIILSLYRVVGFKGKFNRGEWKLDGKIIDTHLKRSTEKMNFLQEAATVSHLKHPNIITFYGIVVDGIQVNMEE